MICRIPAAVAFAIALAHGSGGAQPPAVLTIFMAGADFCEPSLVRAAQLEVEEIMRPAGLPIHWQRLDLSRRVDPVAALVVVRFERLCHLETHCGTAEPGGSLGWAYVSDGDVLPFLAVECDRVRALVEPALRLEPAAERERLFGRAVGRVICHELYHFLANTRSHARRGLAKAALTGVELVFGELRFGARELNVLRESVRKRIFGGRRIESAAGGDGVW